MMLLCIITLFITLIPIITTSIIIIISVVTLLLEWSSADAARVLCSVVIHYLFVLAVVPCGVTQE